MPITEAANHPISNRPITHHRRNHPITQSITQSPNHPMQSPTHPIAQSANITRSRRLEELDDRAVPTAFGHAQRRSPFARPASGSSYLDARVDVGAAGDQQLHDFERAGVRWLESARSRRRRRHRRYSRRGRAAASRWSTCPSRAAMISALPSPWTARFGSAPRSRSMVTSDKCPARAAAISGLPSPSTAALRLAPLARRLRHIFDIALLSGFDQRTIQAGARERVALAYRRPAATALLTATIRTGASVNNTAAAPTATSVARANPARPRVCVASSSAVTRADRSLRLAMASEGCGPAAPIRRASSTSCSAY